MSLAGTFPWMAPEVSMMVLVWFMVFDATFNNISLSYIVAVNYSGDMH
jgi:hypothetical protein